MKGINELSFREIGKIAHGVNKANGFWETPNTESTAVQLMIDEISELHDVLRAKGTVSEKLVSTDESEALLNGYALNIVEGKSVRKTFKRHYEKTCKGKIEEEVADIVIRVLDWLAGNNIIIPSDEDCTRVYNRRGSEITEDLLAMTRNLVGMPFCNDYSERQEIAIRVIVICKFIANMYSFNLKQHILLKVAYNSLRAYKHGKNY